MSDNKVVVIVDEELISSLYKEVLEKDFGSQIKIHCFSSPAKALEGLESLFQVDLLFTGRFSHISGMNGLNLACVYKEKFPTGKLIVASGFDDPAVFEGVNYDQFLYRKTGIDKVREIFGALLQIS